MLLAHTVRLVQRWNQWLYPLPAGMPSWRDQQGIRVSRFLCAVLVFGVFAWILTTDSVGKLALMLVQSIPISWGLLWLCHRRHPMIAAYVYLSATIVSIAWMAAMTPSLNQSLLIVLGASLPICSAGVIFGARACFMAFGAFSFALIGGAAWLQHVSIAQVIQEGYAALQPLLVITSIIALGLRGFHVALPAADRTHELTELNDQLADSLVTIAQREKELTRQRDFLDSVLENIAPDFFFILDRRGGIQRCNEAFYQQMGWTKEQLVGRTADSLFGDEAERRMIREEILPRLRAEQRLQCTHHLLTADGRPVPVESNVAYVPTLHAFIILSRDCTQRQAAEAQLQNTLTNLEILRAVAHACALEIAEYNVAEQAMNVLAQRLPLYGLIITVNNPRHPGFARVLTCQTDDDMSVSEVVAYMRFLESHPISPEAPSTALQAMALGRPIFDQPLPAKPHLLSTAIPLILEGVTFGGFAISYEPSKASYALDHALLLSIAEEIATALHRARLYEEAQQLANSDPLTGLRNHRALQDILQQELATCAVAGLPLSLVMLDIDHFRQFNERYGHLAGDRALRAIAQIVQRLVREGEFAARYGGEEFVIVLPALGYERAAELAQLLVMTTGQTPIVIDETTGEEALLTISLGFATFPIHASAASSLLKAADLALYSAKRAGRDLAVGYSPQLLEEVMPLASASSADDNGEFSLPTGADLEAVQALVAAIDLRDGYTAAHSEGVSRYAVAIARELRLSAEQVEALRLGGYVHDVGKIGVPDDILRKPGKLTEEEWVSMRAHTTMGEAILGRVEQLRHLLPLVRWHHERLDGSGYPDGLRGDQIPALVRILAVADVFEAFTAERPYHPGRPAIEGLHLLRREAAQGKMDGAIVEIFAQILCKQGLVNEGVLGEEDMLEAA